MHIIHFIHVFVIMVHYGALIIPKIAFFCNKKEGEMPSQLLKVFIIRISITYIIYNYSVFSFKITYFASPFFALICLQRARNVRNGNVHFKGYFPFRHTGVFKPFNHRDKVFADLYSMPVGVRKSCLSLPPTFFF